MKEVSPVTLAIQMPSPSRFELFPVLLLKVKLILSPTMLPVQVRSTPIAGSGSGSGSGSGGGDGGAEVSSGHATSVHATSVLVAPSRTRIV